MKKQKSEPEIGDVAQNVVTLAKETAELVQQKTACAAQQIGANVVEAYHNGVEKACTIEHKAVELAHNGVDKACVAACAGKDAVVGAACTGKAAVVGATESAVAYAKDCGTACATACSDAKDVVCEKAALAVSCAAQIGSEVEQKCIEVKDAVCQKACDAKCAAQDSVDHAREVVAKAKSE